MTLPPRVNLVTLGVKDVPAATRFYEKLGWKRSSASMPEISFLHTHGAGLILWDREALAKDANLHPDGTGFRGLALATNVREPADVERALAEAAAAGARVTKP
ncbi:MAG TPA: VOC family protein, partial [Candidatus Thermoplasmatota archaeon]|nr:VOC family protein [Candidatus Thermoplasmatota archaeon]